jgi:carbon starvation protein CstA
MGLFFGGIAFLVFGYFAYGRIVEKILRPDDRPTPCTAHPDGVDFVPLPKWKNQLIQLLNIAGIGPVIGVILGIKFGRIALVVIPVGCVLMGAVHDFVAGMMSLRHGGANLPKLVEGTLGRTFARLFSWTLIGILLLVVAVFVNVPASLIDGAWLPAIPFFWPAVALIFLYYIVATLFPIDKIIGRVYPVFGGLLIAGSFAIALALTVAGFRQPSLLAPCDGFAAFQKDNPLFPCLFVTIACGIISGFHATQSPIVARTMRSEREARSTFFGMMILEGIIAMVWAAAALAMYNLDASLIAVAPAKVLNAVTTHFLGSWVGGVTVASVVVLAVTSGDTALRSARLSLAEMTGIDQVPLGKRIRTSLPLVALVVGLLWWSNLRPETFAAVWKYFAWGNQVMAATTLMAGSVWLLREGRRAGALVALLPGVFMTAVVVTFIFWTSAEKNQPWGLVPGGLPLPVATGLGAAAAVLFAVYAVRRGNERRA